VKCRAKGGNQMKRFYLSALNQKLIYICAISLAVITSLAHLQNQENTFLSNSIADCLYWGSTPDNWFIMIIALTPVFIGASITASYIETDIEMASVFILPRTKNLYKWYICKNISLFLQTLVYIVLYISVIITINLFAAGLKEMTPVNTFFLAKVTVSYFLYTYTSIVFVNIASLIFTSRWALPLYVLLTAISVIMAKNSISHFLPVQINFVVHFFAVWEKTTTISTVLIHLLIVSLCLITGYKLLLNHIYKDKGKGV
jgi:hypothetical protein